MPLPGGPADKIGNRYEDLWTVNVLLDLLTESLEAVRLEPPGESGFEFYAIGGGVQSFHQVKRQTAASGHWTLAQLNRVGVLANFWPKLGKDATRCVFISTQSVEGLPELTERARSADSFAEFQQQFLSAEAIRSAFDRIRGYWDQAGEAEAFVALQRLHIETVSEAFLQRSVNTRLEGLVNGDPRPAAAVLREIASTNIHRELSAYEIWSEISRRGIRRRRWGDDPYLLARVEAQNESYVRALEREKASALALPRSETREVLDSLSLESDDLNANRVVLLVGEAGSGKSNVSMRVIQGLQERGIPHLALRVDRLEPVARTSSLGEQLGLPTSPASVLASISRGEPGVLVIDQLDAVSLASGRNPTFYGCIEELILEATEVYSNLRVLLVCRAFDVENDVRFKRLKTQPPRAREIVLSSLPESVVREAVRDLGVTPERLSPRQLTILALPLHLKLFSEVNDVPDEAWHFQSPTDLLGAFWEHKRQRVRERLGREEKWTQVIDLLCGYMSHHQVLSAPENLLDEFEADAQAMVSEHVLTLDRGRYAFFHESFFDYTFARRFTGRNELLPFLISDPQHLFRRGQVRQVLLYQRTIDKDAYLHDLGSLVREKRIRFHLKQLAVAVLTSVSNPTPEEWRVIEPLLDEPDSPLASEVLQRLLHSVEWFDLLHRLGQVQAWLRSGEAKLRGWAARILASTGSKRPSQITPLVREYMQVEPDWLIPTVHILNMSALVEGATFELLLEAIDAGIGDAGRMWDILHSHSGSTPELACGALAHFLERAIKQGRDFSYSASYQAGGALAESDISELVLEECSKEAPEAFLNATLDSFVQLLELNNSGGDPGSWSDANWYRGLRRDRHRIESELLDALEVALSELARIEPAALRPFLKMLEEAPHAVCQHLLVKAYVACPSAYVDEIVTFLVVAENALGVERNHEAGWGARELIAGVEPFLTDEQMGRLEAAILAYFPEWEAYWYEPRVGSDWPATSLGRTQMVLLDGVPPERLSREALLRLEEWRRRFNHEKRPLLPPAPIEAMAEFAGPPIEPERALRMTDDQWQSAMRRYASESSWAGAIPIGGAHELARVLEQNTVKEPARFAQLLHRLPEDAHPSYYSAILRGLMKASSASEVIMSAAEMCQRIPGTPCARDVLDAIKALAADALPERAYEMLNALATEHPDPDSDPFQSERDPDGGLTLQGINSVRGRAAEAIATVVFHHPEALPRFNEAIDELTTNAAPSVRTCVASILLALLNHDRDRAVRLFLRISADVDDRFLCAPQVDRFLQYALTTPAKDLQAVVERMLASGNATVAKHGAVRACLADLAGHSAGRKWAERCLSGPAPLREGAALVFAANLKFADYRRQCEEALPALFNDDEVSVREAASKCFGAIEAATIAEYGALVHEFTTSRAWPEFSVHLLQTLRSTDGGIPALIQGVCEAWLSGYQQTDIAIERRRIAAARIEELVFRAYNQSMQGMDTPLQLRCLNLVDSFVESRVGHTRSLLEAFER